MKDLSSEVPDEPADFDLDLDQVFARKSGNSGVQAGEPTVGLSPGTQAPHVAPAKEPEGDGRRRGAKFQHRSGEAAKQFTRLVARPSVAVATSAPPQPTAAGNDGEAFAKRRPQERIQELKENKAHSFLLNIFESSSLSWLDPHRLNRILRIGGIVLLVALLVFLTLKFSGNMTAVGTYSGSDVKTKKEGIEARLAAARETMNTFLSAKTWQEKLPFVLEAERVKPLMQQWYEVEKSQDPSVDTAEPFRPREIGGRYWFAFSLKSPSGLPVQMRLQEISSPDGIPTYKIDWENFVALGAMPWAKFCQDRPREPKQMNVYLVKAENFAPPYDQEKFLCFTITHQSGAPTLTGYVEKTNRAAQALETEVAAGNGSLVPANLYMQFDEGAADGQVRIVDLAADWVRY